MRKAGIMKEIENIVGRRMTIEEQTILKEFDEKYLDRFTMLLNKDGVISGVYREKGKIYAINPNSIKIGDSGIYGGTEFFESPHAGEFDLNTSPRIYMKKRHWSHSEESYLEKVFTLGLRFIKKPIIFPKRFAASLEFCEDGYARFIHSVLPYFNTFPFNTRDGIKYNCIQMPSSFYAFLFVKILEDIPLDKVLECREYSKGTSIYTLKFWEGFILLDNKEELMKEYIDEMYESALILDLGMMQEKAREEKERKVKEEGRIRKEEERKKEEMDQLHEEALEENEERERIKKRDRGVIFSKKNVLKLLDRVAQDNENEFREKNIKWLLNVLDGRGLIYAVNWLEDIDDEPYDPYYDLVLSLDKDGRRNAIPAPVLEELLAVENIYSEELYRVFPRDEWVEREEGTFY